MSIFITGDTHGNFKRFTKKQLNKYKYLIGSNDYVIVCGDFGLLWADDKEFKYNLDWFSKLPFTILWVQGNHENYNMIKQYSLEKWNGGYVRHIIKDKVILLERGQIFTIENKTFFTFGGAESNDIDGGVLDRNSDSFKIDKLHAKKLGLNYRILNESWWKEELPSNDEIVIANANLIEYNYTVDYIITHCASLSIQDKLSISQHKKKDNVLTKYFNGLEGIVDFKHWYFGHYHDDLDIDNKHTLVYKEIIKLGE
ncbi:MAG: metallophosphatase family protein [Lachnospiraceae bacterium]|nr:metallophosphatase family protein [Lachnospiraceae bacterium]